MCWKVGFRVLAVASLVGLAACASAPTPKTALVPKDITGSIAPQEPLVHPRIVATNPPLQCVPYARRVSGINIHGNANRWWAKAAGRYPRGHMPVPGAVMVLKGRGHDPLGHVAVVRRIADAHTIIIDHSNWLGRGQINLDAPVIDVSPNHDWSRVRVWYTPSGTWGRHVFQVQGFIYPDQAVASRD